jgi:glutamate formiminotransferase/formiminotetrahydrofolate cyclodeaminase
LPEKLKDPKWKPDFGPAEFNSRAGATAIGAREFLIAYNITLNTREKKYATDIAFELRERGRVARTGNIYPFYFKGKIMFYKENHFPCGNCHFVGKTLEETAEHCKNEHGYDLYKLFALNGVDPKNVIGQKVRRAGKFTHCKAIGWYVDEYDRAQISINLTNYKVTPPHVVLEEARKLAMERGLVVTGSEIVGLVPFQALYQAGLYYLEKQGKSTGVPVRDVIKTAVFSMGLHDVQPFEIEKKVLGMPETDPNALVEMKLNDFVDEVSRDTPAPGGGSIAALSGALGAALASMVANLTQGKEGTEDIDPMLIEIADEAQKIKDFLVRGIDDDTNAFNAYMEARRLPQKTAEEKAYREEKMQEGLKIAINVPFQTASHSYKAMELCRKAVEIGNPNSVTDAAVGAQVAYTGVKGGVWNVLINLKDIKDAGYVDEMKLKCEKLLKDANVLLDEISEAVNAKLEKMLQN